MSNNKKDQSKGDIIVPNEIPLGYEEFLESNNLKDNKDIIQLLISVASGLYHKKISRNFLEEDSVMEMYLSLNEFMTQSSISLELEDQELRKDIIIDIKTRFPRKDKKTIFSLEEAKEKLIEGTQNYKDFIKLYESISEQLAYLFDKATQIFQMRRKVDYIKSQAQIRTLETIKVSGESGFPFRTLTGKGADAHISDDDKILMADDDDLLKPVGLWPDRNKNQQGDEVNESKTR
jgi:archaellum component FlaC